MSDITAERERIGRQLEEGFLTPTEHRRLVRAMERASERRRTETRARQRARAALRRKLEQSLMEQRA